MEEIANHFLSNEVDWEVDKQTSLTSFLLVIMTFVNLTGMELCAALLLKQFSCTEPTSVHGNVVVQHRNSLPPLFIQLVV